MAKRKAKTHLMILDGKAYKVTPLSKAELKKVKSEFPKSQLFNVVLGDL